MTKAQAMNWLERHPEARPRVVNNGLQREWRVFGQHHITYWGPTLVKAIETAERSRTMNPRHHRNPR